MRTTDIKRDFHCKQFCIILFDLRSYVSDVEIKKKLQGYVIFFNYDKYFVCEDELYPL